MAALAAVQTVAFVHTALWWLPIVTLALLVGRLDRATPAHAFMLGWSYGLAWVGAGVWWLFISLHRYGGLAAPLAALAVLALAAALALFLAAACGAYARWRSGGVLRDGVLFAALWLLAELARGVLFTGFPWLASGYSQVDAPWAALAPWVGVYGIGALLALGAVLLARWVQTRRPLPLALLGLAFVLPARLGSAEFTTPGGTLSVSLLQSNVAQDEKFAAERLPQSLDWAARTLAASRADLVIGPETIIPLLPGQLADFAPGYWDALRQRFARSTQAALVGVPLGDFERSYTNSVLGLSAAGEYRYDKHHLVPFGEFIPLGFRWFTELLNIPLGDFSRGVRNPPSFSVRGERVAPNICYEDLFGEELAARFADADKAPTVMANVSNIGWFGDTVALPQHLNISRMRSLELQRPMLRATNTGVTAIIDHRGVVTAQLPHFTQGVLEGSVQGRHGLTVYARWASRWDLWPLWILALTGVAALRLSARPGPSAPAGPGAPR